MLFKPCRVFKLILARLRHSMHDVPGPFFCATLSNLIEMQQPELAKKLALIATSHAGFSEKGAYLRS